MDRIESAPIAAESSEVIRRTKSLTRSLSKATTLERAISSIFVLGNTTDHSSQYKPKAPEPVNLASLSPEELGGIEYRALRVLLKVTSGKIDPLINLSSVHIYRLLLWPPSFWGYLPSALDPFGGFKVQRLPYVTGSRQDLVVCTRLEEQSLKFKETLL